MIPSRGFLPIIVFINSSRIRSAEIISSRLAIFFIAAITAGSTIKSNWLINLAARIILSGSSLKESSGLPGVLITLFCKSDTPPYKSIKVGVSVVNSNAIALIVKSRRDKSPSILSPNSTSGFLESAL